MKASNNKTSRIVDNNSNYISGSNLNKSMKENSSAKKLSSAAVAPLSTYHPMHFGRDLYHQQHLHQMPAPPQQTYNMWQARSYSHESGIGKIDIA